MGRHIFISHTTKDDDVVKRLREILELEGFATLGQYNYTIMLTDLSGNEAIDSCIVTIEDTTIPLFLSADYSNDTETITWIMKDRNPTSYTVYKDGEVIVKVGNTPLEALLSALLGVLRN